MQTTINKLLSALLMPKRLLNKVRVFREEIISLRETSRILGLMIANQIGERQHTVLRDSKIIGQSPFREIGAGVWTDLTGPGLAWSMKV